MSEPIPESIPTYRDSKSRRPTKKRALTPVSAQANHVEALFSHPERDIVIPVSATKDVVPKKLPPPPEIVANVQGSSAGAGSGEFHVYKASRRREYERLRLMDEEMKKEKEKGEFEQKQEELKKKDEAKTKRNQAKREKAKARKQKGKGGSGMDVDVVQPTPTAKEKRMRAATEAVNGDEPESVAEDANQPDANTSAEGEEAGFIIHDDG